MFPHRRVRAGHNDLALNRWRLGFEYLHVEQEVGPRATKKEPDRFCPGGARCGACPLQKLQWTETREFRSHLRNLQLILFLGRACVKANQKFSFERFAILSPLWRVIRSVLID
jgi:hypothetical protein